MRHSSENEKRYRQSEKGRAARRRASYKHSRTAKGRYAALRSRAKTSGLDLTITFEDFVALISLPCGYCSQSLCPTGSGLDRKDFTIGYVHGNVVPCCYDCNWTKGRLEGLGFSYIRILELLQELRRDDS